MRKDKKIFFMFTESRDYNKPQISSICLLKSKKNVKNIIFLYCFNMYNIYDKKKCKNAFNLIYKFR